ncbi:MAG: DUF2461 domain-containing protein [Bacteroidota bacterium]|nr:DUF2461 domain-containing protein [Bacteroidota bacterium]
MKKVLTFLSQIRENNNKEWFDAHKAEYTEANSLFTSFTEKLILGIGEFDPSVRGLTTKDCLYRFYRDIRFSPNKMPYKIHFGAYICPHGKKSGYAGYYFHIEPEGSGYLNGHQLDTGLYCPAPEVLKSVREGILLNGDTFDAAVKEAEGFVLEDSQALKKVPRGYPADFKYADYLKLKNPCLCKHVDDAFILSDHLLENTLEAFSKTYTFNKLLNESVEYALE